MEKWLNNWIMQYVTSDPNASEEVRSKYPLAAAEVKVEEVPGNPGYYSAKFYLRPHYQLDGLPASLRLVSKLPSQKGGGSTVSWTPAPHESAGGRLKGRGEAPRSEVENGWGNSPVSAVRPTYKETADVRRIPQN